MRPLDSILPELAARETRTLVQGKATYRLREYYCDVPGCRCGRVMLAVCRADGRELEAVIGYEPGHPQPVFLLENIAQGPDAEAWLAIVTRLVERDPAFRAQLVDHAARMKAALGPRRKPSKPRAPKRAKPVAAHSAEAALVLAATVKGESKEQARFRRLLAKVDGLREQLRTWTTERPNIDREMALYGAAFDEMLRASRELVAVLVKATETAKLGKRDRREIEEVIVALAEESLEHTDDAEMKAIYNRFSRGDFDRETADAEGLDVLMMKTMLQEMGIAAGDSKATTVDELRAEVRAELDAEERAREGQRAQRKRTPRQMAAEQRRADEERRADKALQAVFRELAKALHPDHERDPAEQQRKSELMREVNAAYEANDLLALLSLQLRLEQVDAAGAAGIAEERVQHYNRILARQEAQLANELESMSGPFRWQLRVAPRAKLTPAIVIGRIRQDALAVQDRTRRLREDVVEFSDAARVKGRLARARRGY